MPYKDKSVFRSKFGPEYHRLWRQKNPGKAAAYTRSYRERNPEKADEYYAKNKERLAPIRSAWTKANKERHAALISKWSKENKPIRREACARRRFTVKQATPAWRDEELIELVYAEADHRGMTVDHIVPLQAPNVCGLHVHYNMQLLSRCDNAGKGSRIFFLIPVLQGG